MVQKKQEKSIEKSKAYECKRFIMWDRDAKKEVRSPVVESVFVEKIVVDDKEPFFAIHIIDSEGKWHNGTLNKPLTPEQRDALSKARKEILGN